MKYYIGIDGGGTKTAICAASEDSSSLLFTKTGSASWREHGVEAVVKRIKDNVDALLPQREDRVAAVAVGLPLYGESAEGDRALEQAVHGAFPDIPLHLTNDVEVGWAGSLALTPGINVVAGTGSIAFGKNERGETARSGGWSEFFSDEGSCYWMGRRVMELFAKQSDGRLPRDGLYQTVRDALKLQNDMDFIDLMHNEYIPSRDKVATLQFFAEKAALAGSDGAKALYAEAAHELCLMVKALADQLIFTGRPFHVSYSGGLFKAGELIIPHFSKGVGELGGNLTPPSFEPVEGALLLAFQRFNPDGLAQMQDKLNSNK
jgi:N-acetylglucosamine kinase-like BadF-type ATPase